MGYTTPATAVPGQTLPAATWNTGIRDSLEDVAKPQRARVKRTTNQSIANNATTAIEWDTEDYDTGLWTPGDPSLFRIPAALNGGYFTIGVSAQFATNGVGGRHISIVKNGTIIASLNTAGNASWPVGGVVTTDHFGNTNDWFGVYVYQNSGAALNLDMTSYPLAFWIKQFSR